MRGGAGEPAGLQALNLAEGVALGVQRAQAGPALQAADLLPTLMFRSARAGLARSRPGEAELGIGKPALSGCRRRGVTSRERGGKPYSG